MERYGLRYLYQGKDPADLIFVMDASMLLRAFNDCFRPDGPRFGGDVLILSGDGDFRSCMLKHEV